MDRRSVSASNDFNLAFDTASSGSIAATTSSGYNGVNTDDTDPDLTFLSNLFPVNYSALSCQTRDPTLLLSLLWQPEAAPIRLPSLMNQTSHQFEGRSQYDNSIMGQLRLQSFPNLGQYPTQHAKSELYVPLLNNYTYRNANANEQSLASRKRQYLLNVHAPTYNATPNSKDIKNIGHGHPRTNLVSYTPDNFGVDKSPLEPASGRGDQVEMLQTELKFKSLVNKTLNEKLKALAVRDDAPATAAASPEDNRITMPSNYYQLFKDLARTLHERTQELEETKTRMEAILVGLVINKESSASTDGTFDPQELAHRITTKLSTLQKENQTLLRMVSHGNKQSLLVELGLLRSENKLLREKLQSFEKGL